jgi:fumarylacetoacetate (FAA) hydrolase family protein
MSARRSDRSRYRRPDNYRLEGTNKMSQISRDPTELVRQTLSEHQYPDGFALFLGTLFAPIQDRDHPGRGFTHKDGDVVRISTPEARRTGQPRHHFQGRRALAPSAFAT